MNFTKNELDVLRSIIKTEIADTTDLLEILESPDKEEMEEFLNTVKAIEKKLDDINL